MDGSERVLLLGAAGPLAAGVLQGARAAGLAVAEAWTGLPRAARVRRLDRGLRLVAPHWSVAALLARQGAPIREVPRLSGWAEAADTARAAGAGILISAGFMQRVPRGLLDAFPGRVFNLHPALLPRRRGPHPVLAALLEGTIARDGGMTLHLMGEAFDEGDIVAQHPVRFDPRRPQAYAFALGLAAARLVARDLPRHLAGALPARPQDDALATSARIAADVFDLGRALPLAVAARRCALVGPLHPFRLSERPGVAVRGPPRPIGPPSGAPPAVGPFAVELDLADARIRLTRRRGLHRWAAAVGRIAEAVVARPPKTMI